MRALWLFALLSAACAALIATRLEVRTAITDFLPRDEKTSLLELGRSLSQAPQARVVVFTVGAAEQTSHLAGAHELALRLRASGLFEWVRAGLSEADQAQLYELFFPARIGLLQLPAGEQPVSDVFIDERVAALKERLSGPLGMLERRLAPDDPLGAFSSLLERQARARGSLTLQGDQLVTADGRFSVLFAATKASAFDAGAQSKVSDLVAETRASLRKRDASTLLEWSGVSRFALAGERSVRGDIERISSLSLLGIFLLYFAVFRSVREPLLVLLPIAFGCLLATAFCQLSFGFVHGLALAFGSSIIGVAEDYSTHYFTHRLAAPASEDNPALMKRLWPGMLMGGITTIAGIALLFFSGFPGLQQMAVFGAVGVLGALLATRYLLPVLSRRVPAARTNRFSHASRGLVRALSTRPHHAWWFVGPALALMAIGLPQLRFDDAVSALRTPAAALDRENARVQARLGRAAGGRVVVALGQSDEQALARAEAVRTALARASERKLVRDYRSVAELVPSAAMQRERHRRLSSDPSFLPRLRESLARHGFVAAAFAPFEAALAQPPRVLAIDTLLASPLADLVAPFRAQLSQGIAYLTPIEGAAPGLGALLAGLEGVYDLDQEALFSAAYGRFRARALTMVALGLALVLATLYFRYRSARAALLGMLPALLGAGAALACEALRGVPATLMHVIAVLLVLSMGVDYGIYALESRSSFEEGGTTLGSVLLAALTTVLSFGLLALSDNPALAAIGSTVGLGMVFTVLASPVVLALTGERV
jgi:predicted exporter